MSKISGITIRLKTASAGNWSTGDYLYLGIMGTIGGREFSLDAENFNDFQAGTEVSYGIGSPPVALPGDGKMLQRASESLQDALICLPNVTHVYLRKYGHPLTVLPYVPLIDDWWRFEFVWVYLGDGSEQRWFGSTGPATLSLQHGLTVYLAETAGHTTRFRNARIPFDNNPSCNPTD